MWTPRLERAAAQPLVAATITITAAALLGAWPASAQPASPFVSPYALEEIRGKQGVVVTDHGDFVIELLADVAPNHVAHFIEQARDGAYDGTVFHRMVRLGIVQGGDPISKDPAKRDLYGTGGLGRLASEVNAEQHTRGAVSAVLQPGNPDSAGAQFFVCVTDQPVLDGQYTVFGRVVEGIEVVQRISETPVDETGLATERVEIRSVTIRDTPPPEPTPFVSEPIETLASTHAVLETTLGEMTIEFLPEKAEQHVRNFLRLAALGVYDGVAFHRVAPGFVVQTGSMAYRRSPLTSKQERHVTTLAPEFNDTPHVKGIVSMARGEDPASASTSFFICTAPAAALDGQYTAFARVIRGLEVLEAIERVPTEGERPVAPVDLLRVRVEPAPR